MGIRCFSSSDGGDVFAKMIFFRFLPGWWFWFVVGAEHAIGFPDGLNDVSVAGIGRIDDLFEAVEEFLAVEAGSFVVVPL